MKKNATYTVEVPIRFTFTEDKNLNGSDLISRAEQELEKRLVNGCFDIIADKLDVVSKVVHYSKKEKEEQNDFWAQIFASSNEEPISVCVKII